MLISNLDHLVLTVTDISASCIFYNTVLELEITTFGDDRKAMLVGDQKINLHKAGDEYLPCAGNPGPGSADLCFITARPIEVVVKHLEKCGVSIELGPVPRTGARGPVRSIYFRDPDGNLLEISNYL